jgi:hypothetical protein
MEERKFDEKGLVDFRIVTHYDRRGLELDFSTYEPNGEISIRQEYEYEFDAAGNWTTQFVSRWVVGWGEFKMTPSMVTRRTIEYF